jgi:hypothetical protein
LNKRNNIHAAVLGLYASGASYREMAEFSGMAEGSLRNLVSRKKTRKMSWVRQSAIQKIKTSQIEQCQRLYDLGFKRSEIVEIVGCSNSFYNKEVSPRMRRSKNYKLRRSQRRQILEQRRLIENDSHNTL